MQRRQAVDARYVTAGFRATAVRDDVRVVITYFQFRACRPERDEGFRDTAAIAAFTDKTIDVADIDRVKWFVVEVGDRSTITDLLKVHVSIRSSYGVAWESGIS